VLWIFFSYHVPYEKARGNSCKKYIIPLAEDALSEYKIVYNCMKGGEMKIRHYTDVALEDVTREGFDGVKARYVITDKEGAPHFSMRVFEFEPGGHTSLHQHPEEHEMFIVEGELTAVNDQGVESALKPGHTLFIPPNEQHQLKNQSGRTAKIICLIPLLNS
jgi:quercetin dioxygenase-like cupin family protein